MDELEIQELLAKKVPVQDIIDRMEFNRTLYMKNGYPNIPYILSSKCPYIVIIGGRGTGKTYGMFKYLTETVKEKFIYMRRTSTALDSCMDDELNPFTPINNDLNRNIRPFKSDKRYTFLDCDSDDIPKDSDNVIAIGVSLSTAYNLRGFSGQSYKWLYFDEVIKEPLEKTRNGEATAFKHFIETCNRNRELNGDESIRCILTGNADSLDSDILFSVGAIGVIERMKASKQEVYINTDQGLAVFDLTYSPISVLKKYTSLYKLNKHDRRFLDVSIKNEFADLAGDETIKPMPINHFKPWCSLNNDIYIYQHKSDGTLYITFHKSGTFNKNFDTAIKEQKQAFKKIYETIWTKLYLTNTVFFETYETKVAYEIATGHR